MRAIEDQIEIGLHLGYFKSIIYKTIYIRSSKPTKIFDAAEEQVNSPLFWFLCLSLLFLYMMIIKIVRINKVSKITMTAIIVDER